MQEIPTYTIKPNILRNVLPSFLVTLILCILFYFGVYLNVTLLGVEIPSTIQILIISTLSLLAIIQALLTYVQSSKTTYLVYNNRIQLGQQYVMFNSVQNLSLTKNVFDSLFNTGTIKINELKLTGIANPAQVHAYLNQMLTYSRNQYNQI